jgi:hypothetical protein
MDLNNLKESGKNGCDFIVNLKENREINLLQITDMQIIDSWQRRSFDRIRTDEINAWSPENFDIQCGNHIRSLIAQTNPDLIFITGDIIYGSFDDNGTTFEWFCSFMDSFAIPWAPVFGNHDNESRKGTAWQCEQFEKSKYCLFKRGTVSGNGNYCVGISVNDRIIRVIHMLDSNGCSASEDPDVIKTAGIYPDQIESVREKTNLLENAYNEKIPAFLAFHIPVEEFEKAEIYNGYKNHSRDIYTIGVDVPQKNGDFGFKLEPLDTIKTTPEFLDTLKQCNVDGVFAGHSHNICTSIAYEGIRWTFGLKTGQYDYHIPGQLGGTLIQLENNSFKIRHIPSLVQLAPFPGGANMFRNFFAEDSKILKDSY